MEDIKIESKFADQSGEIMVIELGGHIDQSNSYQLQKMFDNIIQSGSFKVIVDFGDLYYMSSAGWGVFVGEIKRFRENGGDIKLANMNPEIYEVYQMLEFYHILEDFPTIEDAAASFRKEDNELNLVLESDEGEEAKDTVAPAETNIEEMNLFEPQSAEDNAPPKEAQTEIIELNTQEDFHRKSGTEFIPHALKKDVKLAELPISEKIKHVVAQNPLLGIFGIRRVLRHENFGRTKIGYFRLKRLLRELDLNTKEKRYRYYRSC